MPDREKVINAIECCIDGCLCAECDYEGIEGCWNKVLLTDALALLQEQEAVEPITEPSAKGYWFTCGSCGWWLFEVRDTVHFDDRKRIHYCASCGQAVKWE